MQLIWAYLQETCMPPHVCPICLQKCSTCHQYNPVSQLKSPLCYQKEEALRLICGLSVFKRAVYRMKRGLLSRGVTRIDLCNMSLENHVCCSVLQCVAVCCSVLQCVTVCGSVCYSECCGMLQCVAVSVDSCEVSPSYHVRCSVLQRVAACCSVPFSSVNTHTQDARGTYVQCVCVCVCARARVKRAPSLSHGTHVNEAWHTCHGVTAHIRMSHVTGNKQSRESWHKYE